MIVKLPPNVPYRLQVQNSYSKNAPTVMRSNNDIIQFGASEITKLRPRRKTSEALSPVTLRILKKAEEKVMALRAEADKFVKQEFTGLIIPEFIKRWSKNGIRTDLDFRYRLYPQLTNLDETQPKTVPVRSFVTNKTRFMRPNYKVREGKHVYEIYLNPQNLGGSIKLRSKKGAAQSVNFNQEVQRIVNTLLAAAPQTS